MNTKTLQNEDQNTQPNSNTPETNPTTPPSTPSTSENISRENFRLYSLVSSNYCNLINLFNNIIAKTSSSKKETYQEINASLRVDQTTFNNNFNTICNMEQYSFCNYNQLIYTTIENWIDLVDNLSTLTLLSLNTSDYNTVIRLRNNAFNLFRQFIYARPIRY